MGTFQEIKMQSSDRALMLKKVQKSSKLHRALERRVVSSAYSKSHNGKGVLRTPAKRPNCWV